MAKYKSYSGVKNNILLKLSDNCKSFMYSWQIYYILRTAIKSCRNLDSDGVPFYFILYFFLLNTQFLLKYSSLWVTNCTYA